MKGRPAKGGDLGELGPDLGGVFCTSMKGRPVKGGDRRRSQGRDRAIRASMKGRLVKGGVGERRRPGEKQRRQGHVMPGDCFGHASMKGRPVKGGDQPVPRQAVHILDASMKGRPMKGGDTRIDHCSEGIPEGLGEGR
jgi:hypothetical protein